MRIRTNGYDSYRGFIVSGDHRSEEEHVERLAEAFRIRFDPPIPKGGKQPPLGTNEEFLEAISSALEGYTDPV